jgi:hypothetical protein
LSAEADFYPVEREEGMSQICNCSSGNSVTLQDLKTYTFRVAGMSACGKETVITSAVMPEVDTAIGYSDNPKYCCQNFLCGYLYRGNWKEVIDSYNKDKANSSIQDRRR